MIFLVERIDQWMNKEKKIILKELILRYDYGGSCELMKGMQVKDAQIEGLLASCKHGLNFDFKGAYEEVWKLDEDEMLDGLKRNLKDLMDGKPEAIFSELMENTRIQLLNHQYIDFLSRIYRLKEAILKYIFVKNHIDKKNFSFMSEIVSKRMILKILRKKHKIYNPNLSYAIGSYINKYLNKDKKYMEILESINSNKMNEIIELRHASIAGHGFKGINRQDLVRIYGNPYHIVDDFSDILEKLHIKIVSKKYDKLNQYILERLENINV